MQNLTCFASMVETGFQPPWLSLGMNEEEEASLGMEFDRKEVQGML